MIYNCHPTCHFVKEVVGERNDSGLNKLVIDEIDFFFLLFELLLQQLNFFICQCCHNTYSLKSE